MSTLTAESEATAGGEDGSRNSVNNNNIIINRMRFKKAALLKKIN